MQGRVSLRGRRVLVVEDEAAVSLMIADLLTEAGCKVIGSASTTDSALALIEQEAIDCAVLDVNSLTGKCSPLPTLWRHAGCLFVFATGYQAEVLGGRYAGVPRIEKVYGDAELLDAIAVILDPNLALRD